MKNRKFTVRIFALAAALLMLLPMASTGIFAQEEEGETYVFEELREYLVQDTYVANDGKIGIPMSVCTYAKIKPSETTATTTVLIYVLGYNGERIGTEVNKHAEAVMEKPIGVSHGFFANIGTHSSVLLFD